MALGEEAGAQAGDDGHRVVVEAAQAGLDDVGRVGGAPVDDAAGGGLVTEAGEESGGNRAGAQRENADPVPRVSAHSASVNARAKALVAP